MFDNEFGYREPPPTPIPTMPLPMPCLGFGCCRKKGLKFVRTACHNPVSQEDLEHVTCLMDEQLNLLEQYFLGNGIGQTDAVAIKDEAKQFLEANAYNDDGFNPDLINWFLPGGTLVDIYSALESVYLQITPPNADVIAITSQQEYMTLLSQLQLMSDIGDPMNKDDVNKDQFKSIDWNTVIPPGTTKDSFDVTSVISAVENEIVSAGGIVPAGLEDSIGRTGNDAQSIFPFEPVIPTSPLTSTTHPASSTLHPDTPMPTSTASLINSSTSASTTTTTRSTTLESDSSTTEIQSLPTVTQIATQTDAVSGSGGANSNGFGNDITNSNGLGSMFGDPHIRIKNPNEPAICFDIEG